MYGRLLANQNSHLQPEVVSVALPVELGKMKRLINKQILSHSDSILQINFPNISGVFGKPLIYGLIVFSTLSCTWSYHAAFSTHLARFGSFVPLFQTICQWLLHSLIYFPGIAVEYVTVAEMNCISTATEVQLTPYQRLQAAVQQLFCLLIASSWKSLYTLSLRNGIKIGPMQWERPVIE